MAATSAFGVRYFPEFDAYSTPLILEFQIGTSASLDICPGSGMPRDSDQSLRIAASKE